MSTGIEKIYNSSYWDIKNISSDFSFNPYGTNSFETNAYISNPLFNPYGDNNVNYYSNSSMKDFTDGIFAEANKIEKNSPQANPSSNDSKTNPKTSKLKENIGKLFENISYADMKKLQEIEIKIAQLERRLSTSDEADKTKLNAELEQLKIEYEKIEMECFAGENLNEKYGKAGKYNFYSNISTDEFKLLVSRNEKISEYQTQLDEKNSEIDELNKLMNSAQDAQEKSQYKIQIKALERQKQKIINKINQEIDLVTVFLKKATEDQSNITIDNVKISEENAKKEAENKEAFLKAFFDEKGNLVPEFKSKELVLSCEGKELDKELVQNIANDLYEALKNANANKANMEQIIVNWLNIMNTEKIGESPLAKILFSDAQRDFANAERVFIFNQILLILINKNISSLNGIQSGQRVNSYIKAVNQKTDELKDEKKLEKNIPTSDLDNLYSSYLTNDAKKLYNSKLKTYIDEKKYDILFDEIDNCSLNINDKKALYQKVSAEALKSVIEQEDIGDLNDLRKKLISKVKNCEEINIDGILKDIYIAWSKKNKDFGKTFEDKIKTSDIDIKEKFKLLKLINLDKYSIYIDNIDKLSADEKKILNSFKITDNDVNHNLSKEMKSILATLIQNDAIVCELDKLKEDYTKIAYSENKRKENNIELDEKTTKKLEEYKKNYFLIKLQKDMDVNDLKTILFRDQINELIENKEINNSALTKLTATDDNPKVDAIKDLNYAELCTILTTNVPNTNTLYLSIICEAMYSGYNDTKALVALVKKLNELAKLLGIEKRIKADTDKDKFVFTAAIATKYKFEDVAEDEELEDIYDDCDEDDLECAINALINEIQSKIKNANGKLNF